MFAGFFRLGRLPMLLLLAATSFTPRVCSLSTEPSRRDFLRTTSAAATASLMPSLPAASATASMPTVCVTGANGYIGLHCVSQLLEAGYSVRAAVRSLSENKTKWLTKVATDAGASDRISFTTIDLNDVESMANAVQGCDSLLHVASPLALKSDGKDLVKSIVEPAVSGACNAVLAAKKVGLRRVVSTGSVFGMVGSGSERGYDHVYNDQDVNGFNTPRGCSYAYSKREAQQKSMALANDLEIDMVTLNVGQVCGPALSPDQTNPSWEPFKLLSKAQPGGAVLSSCVPAMVDVRDVALAHVAALRLPSPASSVAPARRYVVAAQKSSPTYKEISELMSEILPDRNLPSKVETLSPKAQRLVAKGIGLGDRSLGELIEGLSVPPNGATILVDIDPMIKDLVPKPIGIRTSLVDWIDNQLAYGHSV